MGIRLLLVGGLAVVALAGCGSSAPTPYTGPSSAPSSSPVVSLPPKPTPTGLVTLTGTLQDGVEPNCTLLNTPGKQYLLVGVKRAALPSTAGATVTVIGTPDPGLVTTCQQGTPFRVSSVQPG
jgi:hypothetical protein